MAAIGKPFATGSVVSCCGVVGTANATSASTGDSLHVDVKKLGRVPAGGGWRVHGRREEVRGRGIGWDYVHVAINDHTRLASAEMMPDKKTGN
ncbi:MAG: hypothetical protein ACXVX8_05555 [Blastococcus sp.]